MSFYPVKFKDTQKDTIGKWYTRARVAMNILFMGSGLIYSYVDKFAGFVTLCISAAIYMILTGREQYIQSVHNIRTIGDLRTRLLFFGDTEHVFQGLANDNTWRSEPVDPEITERLTKIRLERTEFHNKVDEFLKGLLPVDEGKQN